MSDTPALPTDPDRSEATLLLAERVREEGPYAAPGEGSFDARLPLKQLFRRVEQLVNERGGDEARAHFASVDRPHLRAGTVSDATARAIRVRLEEVESLCSGESGTAAESPHGDLEPHEIELVEGKALRKRREFLIASGGARVRFSRKGGVLFVDRKHDVHAEDCLRFEDRTDRGDLDGFLGDPDERPRLFSPAYLKAVRFEKSARFTKLELAGRLGRRANGFPCRLTFSACADSDQVALDLAIDNQSSDHRLRLRVLGCRNPAAIQTETAPFFRPVFHRGRALVATTLLRSCGRLRLGASVVEVPDAQCHGTIHHRFLLGGSTWQQPVGAP